MSEVLYKGVRPDGRDFYSGTVQWARRSATQWYGCPFCPERHPVGPDTGPTSMHPIGGRL